MAQTYLDSIAGLSKLGLPATIERGKAAPLDKYYLQDTYADALTFAKTHGAAYPYMPIAVDRDSDSSLNGVYFILNPGPDAEIVPVGASGAPSSAANYSEALTFATTENVGRVIYVLDNEGVGEDTKKAGPYIVTGAGSLAKLGTTTATGDLAADLAAVQGKVGTLKTDVDALKGVIGNESTGLVADIAGVKDGVDALKGVIGNESTGLVADIASVKDDVANLQTAIDSKIGSVKVDGVEIEAVDGVVDITLPSFTLVDVTEHGGLKKYQLYKDNKAIEGSIIEFDKDLFVKKGSMYTANEDSATVYPNQPEGTFEAGKKYIKLELNDDAGSFVFIKLEELFTPYQGSDYIAVSDNNAISVKVDDLKAELEGTFATKEELDTLTAQIISVGGSGAIDVTGEGTALTVSLLVKGDEDGNPLKGNIKFTQSAEDGLVGEMVWNQY